MIADNGVIWLGGTSDGITAYENGKFTNYPGSVETVRPRVRAFVEDKDGRIWACGYGGISIYDQGKFTQLTVQNGLPSSIVYRATRGRDDTIWLGITGAGVVGYDGHAWTHLSPQDGLICGENIMAFEEDIHGDLWIGGGKGAI